MLNTSGNLLKTVLKVKNRRVVWVQNGNKRIVSDWELLCLTGCRLLPSIKRVSYITSLGKDQNPKFEVQLLSNAYCFSTIVKSNHH